MGNITIYLVKNVDQYSVRERVDEKIFLNTGNFLL